MKVTTCPGCGKQYEPSYRQAIEIALLRGALAKIVCLEESEGDDPLDEAVGIARHALLTAG